MPGRNKSVVGLVTCEWLVHRISHTYPLRIYIRTYIYIYIHIHVSPLYTLHLFFHPPPTKDMIPRYLRVTKNNGRVDFWKSGSSIGIIPQNGYQLPITNRWKYHRNQRDSFLLSWICVCIYIYIHIHRIYHIPLKTNMESNNGGFDDDFSFQQGDFQVPC